MAAARPLAKSHSIWELVLHLITWKNVVRRRLDSKVPVMPSDEENFPVVPAATPGNWATTLERLQLAHDALVEAVRATSPDALEQTVAGKNYSKLVMLLGIPQHDDYHAGQMALLKKAARSAAGNG